MKMIQRNWQEISLKIGSVLLLSLAVIALFWLIFRLWPTRPVEVGQNSLKDQARMEEPLKDVETGFDNPKVIVNPYKISPLTALIMFKTDQPQSASVTIAGKDELTTFRHTFPATKEHRLPIYGLYPGMENAVELQVGEKSKTLKIKTDKLPETMPKVLEVKKSAEKLTNQLYFMTPSSANAKTMAYDVNGEVRWWLDGRHGWEIKRLKNGHLLLGGGRLIAEPYYLANMYEMDLLGKIYAEYLTPGGYHHDYHEMENGNLIVAVNNIGRSAGTTVEDTVIEIDRKSGKIVKLIDLGDLLPKDAAKSLDWSYADWFHNNSVYLKEDTGELILSGRHQDVVINIDYKTDKLNYILGTPDGWPKSMQQYFLTPTNEPFEWQWEQHAATFLPNGDLMLFDNGTHRSKHKDTALPADKNYSRAVIYRVNKDTKSIEQVWQYGKQRGHEYFSPYISDADYLGENHILVHSGGVSYKDGVQQNLPASIAKSDTLRSFTTEVLNDEVIFEIQTDGHFYRAEKMPLYYEGESSLSLGEAPTIGQPAETRRQAWKLPFFKVQPIDKTYKDAQISLEREVDRLVIKGTFHENDVVQLVLSNGKETWRHRVPMKSGVFSNAACIDTFDTKQPKGDKVEIEQYMNRTRLSGKYDIYLQFNGRLYKTGRDVEF